MAGLIRGQGSLALLPRKASFSPCTLPERNLWGTQSLGDTGKWVKQLHQDSAGNRLLGLAAVPSPLN